MSYSRLFTYKRYIYLLFSVICQVLWNFGLIYASLHTIQSQAYVLNNIHGLFIVIMSHFLGVYPSKYEWIGFALAILGSLLMMIDPHAGRIRYQDGVLKPENVLKPAIVDLVSAFFGAIFFLMQARNVREVPICALIVFMNIHIFFLNSLLATVYDPSMEVFSFSREEGCFGFLAVHAEVIPLLCMTLFTAFFGSAGSVLCALFYSPMVTS